LYRGCDYGRRRRMSWTEDEKLATWFASRTALIVPEWACVVTAVVPKNRLIARFEKERSAEPEWVMDPRGLLIRIHTTPADLISFDDARRTLNR
jgi:hypothetical protein